MDIDYILSSESDQYTQIAVLTQFLSNHDGFTHRHIFDVMRQIKSVIPAEVFEQYRYEYEWIVNDCQFRAPEVFGDCWNSLKILLIRIERDHPNQPFVTQIKNYFSGTATYKP